MGRLSEICKEIRLRTWLIWRLLFRPCNLEIHLSEHCNLNCAGCSHYSPLAEPSFCDAGRLREWMSKLSPFAGAFRTIRLLGGEPLLNPDVAQILTMTRECFPKSEIELLTNGLLLSGGMSDGFWSGCRSNDVAIGVTVYPTGADYAAIERRCREEGVRFSIYGDRTASSCFEIYALDPAGRGRRCNYYRCREMDFLQLAGGKIFSCAQCAYVGHLNKAFGCDFRHSVGDSIEVGNIKSAFSLRMFRLRTKPFCKYCIFPRRNADWQLSKRTIEEWVPQNVNER